MPVYRIPQLKMSHFKFDLITFFFFVILMRLQFAGVKKIRIEAQPNSFMFIHIL